MGNYAILSLVTVLVICVLDVKGTRVHNAEHYSNNAYQHKLFLGPDQNYILEWTIDWQKRSIIFNVSAECKGYIGIGLSQSGSISDSDFAIGGIDSNGKPYFSDMRTCITNGSIQADNKRDWELLHLFRENGQIHMSASRPLETCDEEDLQITDDLVHVIWAYGNTDEVVLFAPYHGNISVYLLDPDLTPKLAQQNYRQIAPGESYVESWRFRTVQTVPIQRDSQLCSIIKGPRLSAKRYILGGGAYLPFKDAKKHVKQIILSRCETQLDGNRSTDQLLDPFVGRKGQDCDSSDGFPSHLCTEIVFLWSQGGNPFYLPEDVAIPFAFAPDEYFLLQINYHNPENMENVTVKAGLELVHHLIPRKFEGGIQRIGYGAQGLFLVPPRSTSFNVYGHCSQQCIMESIPAEGLNVFAVMFQMNNIGKSVRLRHFRENAELPWILKDDNYRSTFQNVRLLSKPAQVQPGDQLTLQCTFDTSSVSTTTFSGSLSDQEQCVAYIFVNKRMTSAWCSSEYSVENQLKDLGIINFPRNDINSRGVPVVLNTANRQGLMTIMEKNVRWSPSIRATLQREMINGNQMSSCPTHQQIANPRALPVSRNTNKDSISRVQNAPKSAFVTPFATGNVTTPRVSSEYRPTLGCNRSGTANFKLVNKGLDRNEPGKTLPEVGNRLSSRRSTINRLRRFHG